MYLLINLITGIKETITKIEIIKAVMSFILSKII